jgi:hypothetical protein
MLILGIQKYGDEKEEGIMQRIKWDWGKTGLSTLFHGNNIFSQAPPNA